MAEETPQSSFLANQLSVAASKILKPGGVTVGSLVGLWYLFVQSQVAEAIAAALIGLCVSYLGKVWEPIDRGNQGRFTNLGEAANSAIDDALAQLLAKATGAEDIYLLCQVLDCRDYKPEGMGARDRIFLPMLQEVFVPLEFDSSAIRPGFNGLPGGKPSQGIQDDDPELCIWTLLAYAQNEPAYRQMAIVAWGGFGKTTLLKHLAYIYGSKQHETYGVTPLVPFFLPLRAYRTLLTQAEPPTLPELVMIYHLKSLAELDDRLQRLPGNWAQDVLMRGKALVLMDGFDEIPEPDRPALSRWINAQMRRFDRSIFIVTSRPAAYTDSFVDPLRTKLWVRPFQPQQQRDFVHQWYHCQERLDRGGRDTPEVQREAKRNAENLLHQINDPNRPELAALARNPLLLNLLATYHRSNPGVELPRQRAELYQDICTLQLRKRPDAREIQLPLTPEERQGVLQTVALDMMQRNLRLISEADLVALIAETLVAQNIAQNAAVDAASLLKQLIDVSELIVRQGLEGCEFSHLSFQEFLAAAQLKKPGYESILYPHLADANTNDENRAWWRQTILLYAAQTNPTTLIQEALRQGANDLAYACYQETRSTLDPNIIAALEAVKPALTAARYAKLEELLKAGQWCEADEETYRLMITTVGKEEGQWFDPKDLEEFPCEDLQILDQLWVKYSNGKFGFSVQKKIWQECGSPMTSGKEWDDFCIKVGWQDPTGSPYMNSSELMELKYDLDLSSEGELPSLARVCDEVTGITGFSLAQRLVDCIR